MVTFVSAALHTKHNSLLASSNVDGRQAVGYEVQDSSSYRPHSLFWKGLIITEQRGRFSLQPSHISAETESFGLAREFSRLQYVQSLTPPLLFADKKKEVVCSETVRRCIGFVLAVSW